VEIDPVKEEGLGLANGDARRAGEALRPVDTEEGAVVAFIHS
jgi:hypothetical protein